MEKYSADMNFQMCIEIKGKYDVIMKDFLYNLKQEVEQLVTQIQNTNNVEQQEKLVDGINDICDEVLGETTPKRVKKPPPIDYKAQLPELEQRHLNIKTEIEKFSAEMKFQECIALNQNFQVFQFTIIISYHIIGHIKTPRHG